MAVTQLYQGEQMPHVAMDAAGGGQAHKVYRLSRLRRLLYSRH